MRNLKHLSLQPTNGHFGNEDISPEETVARLTHQERVVNEKIIPATMILQKWRWNLLQLAKLEVSMPIPLEDNADK